MQAIILAGGFGTRLQSVVSDVPKPMAPINGKPFLEYMLDELNIYGFTKAVLAVGYKKECIMDYFQNKYKNIDIVYSIEDEPLGTGGCVKQAMKFIDDDFVFVLNGDTMFKIDFNKMSQINKLSIACKRMFNFDRYGKVNIENGIIQSFSEKMHVDDGYINGGIYYLPKNIFDKFDLEKKFSMEKDFFEKYMSNLNINAFLSEDYFIDIGIPEDYEKAQTDFKRTKALFLDRDGVINIDYGHVCKIEDFKFTKDIFSICEKYQKNGFIIIVVTNQAGIAKGLYSLEDYNILNNYMIEEFKKHNIIISKTYYCPHKESDNCDCRKPKSGLYFKAIKEFNIDVNESVAIGDKLSDLEAAYNVGVTKLYFKKTKYKEYPVKFDYIKVKGKKETIVYSDTDNKKRLAHLRMNKISSKEVIDNIDDGIKAKKKRVLVPVNLDMMRVARKNKAFNHMINKSDLSIVDGKPLIWLSKIARNKIKEKISGSDLIYPVLDLCDKNGYSIFIVGGIKDAPQKACDNIKAKYPNVDIKGYFSPEFGFEKNAEKTNELVEIINDKKADIVLLCLSAPKQEMFYENNKNKLYNSTYYCAGATVDFLAGRIKRAPKWMSKVGLEWFYRFMKEPKRLFKRYWLDFWFLLKIFFVVLFQKKG